MSEEHKPRTSELNGRLWGSSADDWADIQEAACRAVYDAVMDRVALSPGTSYLDAGCGAGMAAQIAQERGAVVCGHDAASALVDIARKRVPDGEFSVGDLEDLPFEDAKFELVTGFNSFQYAGNPVLALSEAKRVSKPKASVVIVTWGAPEGMEAASLLAALKPLLPRPPPGAPGPFALSDESALRDFASSAGLDPIEVFDVDSPWHYMDLQTALRGLRSSGVSAKAIENTSIEAVSEAYAAALEPFRQNDGSFRIGATFRCLLTHA
jgi:ubiquinone/menaquinone biosynthesis C-methylase UbiE